MATNKVLMPHLAETVVEGTVVRWLKREGEPIQLNEPLVEIMTDKVTVEMPSPAAGVLIQIVAPEGATVPVGAEMAVIEGVGAPAQPMEPLAGERAEVRLEAAAPPEAPRRHSPVVIKLAEEHGVDLSQVRGTGIGGRVTKEDLLAFVAQRQKGLPTVPIYRDTAAPAPPAEAEAVPISPLRRAIAERMTRSAQTVPHAWAIYELDITDLVQWREQIKEEFRAREGVNLTYLPFVIRAVAEALRAHPILNASWAGDKIILQKRINVGVAVATGDGLIVPILRDADQKSIAGLAKEFHLLIEKARAGKLSLEDVQGGTFTVNNAGVYGTVLSVPVINYPQAAILTMDAIRKRAVVLENDAVAVRSVMSMTLAFDHRLMDGATAGLFMQKVKSILEGFGSGTPLS